MNKKYAKKRTKREQAKFLKRIDRHILVFLFIMSGVVGIGNYGIAQESYVQTTKVKVERVELPQIGNKKMSLAIYKASKEFKVPMGLILGIAKAESSMGTRFVHKYDYQCHNWWGIRKVRNDGSYLRCFNDEVAGARTMAKTLRLYYLDEGRITPEQICQKWIGGKYAKQNCPHWVNNVKLYIK